MQDTNTYIEILASSLHKKNKLLDNIIKKNKEQWDILNAQEFSETDFDANMKAKSEMIDQLNILNSGFDEVYDHVKDELVSNSSAHAPQIKEMKKLISEIVSKSVAVETGEQKNYEAATKQFAKMKQHVKKSKMSRNVAAHYYKNMSNLVNVDSQFLDRRK